MLRTAACLLPMVFAAFLGQTDRAWAADDAEAAMISI